MQTISSRNRVLLVEDDARLRSVLARALRRHGYEVREADSVSAAHATLASTAVRAAIIDVNLPDATGWDIVRWAQANCQQVPKLIMISAAGFSAARMRELHTDATLSKPFPIDALVQHLGRPVIRRGELT